MKGRSRTEEEEEEEVNASDGILLFFSSQSVSASLFLLNKWSRSVGQFGARVGEFVVAEVSYKLE